MDLSTTYLGFTLPHPVVVGASPIASDLDLVRRAEDAGAAAIVMSSLFEEQIALEELAAHRYTDDHAQSFAEALSFVPEREEFAMGPDEYLEQIRRIKAAVKIPLVASLNGITPRGWLRYAKLIESAGADALELNVYQVGVDPDESAEALESRIVVMVRMLKSETRLPLAIKLSPFFTSLAHFARRLDETGVDGLVLFNRFYQPDIDVEGLDVVNRLELSTQSELRLRLRWLAALSGHLHASLAASGGVHEPLDVLKAVMAGANAVQVVSALLHEGPEHIKKLTEGVRQWLEEHEYESLAQSQGSMNLLRCPNPRIFERGNYMRILQSYHESIPARH